jgi:hypothetical protein
LDFGKELCPDFSSCPRTKKGKNRLQGELVQEKKWAKPKGLLGHGKEKRKGRKRRK